MSLPVPPVALTPWQAAHVFQQSCFPAAIDSGVDATGFLSWPPRDYPARKEQSW